MIGFRKSAFCHPVAHKNARAPLRLAQSGVPSTPVSSFERRFKSSLGESLPPPAAPLTYRTTNRTGSQARPRSAPGRFDGCASIIWPAGYTGRHPTQRSKRRTVETRGTPSSRHNTIQCVCQRAQGTGARAQTAGCGSRAYPRRHNLVSATIWFPKVNGPFSPETAGAPQPLFRAPRRCGPTGRLRALLGQNNSWKWRGMIWDFVLSLLVYVSRIERRDRGNGGVAKGLGDSGRLVTPSWKQSRKENGVATREAPKRQGGSLVVRATRPHATQLHGPAGRHGIDSILPPPVPPRRAQTPQMSARARSSYRTDDAVLPTTPCTS